MKYPKFQLSLIFSIVSLLVFPSVAYTHSFYQLNLEQNIETKKQVNSKFETKDKLTQNQQIDIQNLAKNITVKVYVKDSAGSGIIINKQGNTYTVLTNAHVITRGKPYRIKTSDNQVHQAILKQAGKSIAGNDLAILEFQSTKNYQIAKLGSWQDIKVNDTVYTTGFPYNSKELNIVSGKVTLIGAKPLKGGYQIGYTNQTQQGMSGGALINKNGEVIGVIGMGDNAIFSQDAYTYQDDTQPDINTVAKMKQSSFAVPINTLAQVAPQLTALLPKNSQIANIPEVRAFVYIRTIYTGIMAEIDKTADKVTVKIETFDSWKQEKKDGSGVIIAKDGKTYYVLTARHVVEQTTKHEIMTPDFQKHQVTNIQYFEDWLDLALVKFTSDKNYPVAKLGNYNLKQGIIYLSGHPQSSSSYSSVESWVRDLTIGYIFPQEYSDFVIRDASFISHNGGDLTYTALSKGGMSGGPIFDIDGRVIGINIGAENGYDHNHQKDEGIEYSLGHSLGISITKVLNNIKDVNLNPNLLTVENNKPTKDFQSIGITFPRPSKPTNNNHYDWLNYGHRLWSYRQYKDALLAFNKAIDLKI